MNLIEQVKVLAGLREKASELSQKKDELFTDWENRHRELLNNITTAKMAVQEAENTLRLNATEGHKLDGNKNPCPGITIKLFTKLDYDLSVAQLWGYQHGICLKLDISAFEKIARVSPPEFVTISQQPQCQIAQDLFKVLKEKENET